MQTIPLYRYTRPDGGVTVSTVKPDGDYTELTRLVADDGYTLTDGASYTSCTDTDDPALWAEIPGADDEATESDYQDALREMVVNV